MEVTLNHTIKQFSLLAPPAFRNNFFEKLFDCQGQFKKPFEMQGRGVDKKFALANCMQPDFLFISEGEVVSIAIEMKIKSKCSVDQVLKYALLGRAVEVLLGFGDITSQFLRRFKSSGELTDAIKKQDLTKFLANKPKVFRQNPQELERIVNHMSVQFLNYKDFTDILESTSPPQADQSAGAEVYRNLINGICNEISRGKLS